MGVLHKAFWHDVSRNDPWMVGGRKPSPIRDSDGKLFKIPENHCACPWCKSRGCEKCEGRGYVTENQYRDEDYSRACAIYAAVHNPQFDLEGVARAFDANIEYVKLLAGVAT